MRLSKFIVILLILISVFALLTVPAAAHVHGETCPLMDEYLGEGTYGSLTPWPGVDGDTNSLPSQPGNYYLTADITLTESWKPVGTGSICLNGYAIKQTGEGSVIRLDNAPGDNQVLRLFDCNLDREHYFHHDNTLDCWVWDGADVTTGDHTVTGGIITGGYAKKKDSDDTDHYGKGGAVYIGEGHEMYLYDVYLVGNRADTGGGGVFCNGGTFEMYDGDIIGNNGGENPTSYQTRGAVCIYNGEFTIHDGNITTNYACCGVYLNGNSVEDAKFEMHGGEISEHKSDSGVFMNNGNFTMHGGTIKKNIGAKNDAAPAGTTPRQGDNGGVHVNGGVFNMHGGVITDNERDGVVVRGGTFNMYEGALITGNGLRHVLHDFMDRGCGVSISGDEIFNMFGGEISGHDAGMGAGVYMSNGIFNMNGGKIRNNKGEGHGAGVCVRDAATFNMIDGFIEDNVCNGSSKQGGGVYIDGGGKFNMSGGKIINNTATSNGGGVGMDVNKDKENNNNIFTMTGGTIANNKANSGGGGVYLGSGTFTMNDGTIASNTASSNGGGMYYYKGIFTMNGGEITSNTASGNGGGVCMSWDDNNKVFTMTGGEITGNTATSNGGGVLLGYGTFIMSGGNITSNTANNGGGVYDNGGTFTMSGSTITSNTASGNGGGVYKKADGVFTMNDGTIASNKANNGGGVYLDSGKFIMNDGVIENHKSTSGKGAGVHVYKNGIFTMHGGRIQNNGIKNTNPGNGGGVYINEQGTFNMYKGYITGNSAQYGGGGVSMMWKDTTDSGVFNLYGGNITNNIHGGVHVDSGTFTISSTDNEVINISGNKQSDGTTDGNVWLYDRSQGSAGGRMTYITIGEGGTGNIAEPIGVRFDKSLGTSERRVFATSSNPAHDYSKFTSEYSGQTWYVDYDTEDNTLVFTLTQPQHSTYTVVIPPGDLEFVEDVNRNLRVEGGVEVTALSIQNTEFLRVTAESQNDLYLKLVDNPSHLIGYSIEVVGGLTYSPGYSGVISLLEVSHDADPLPSKDMIFTVTQEALSQAVFAGEYKDVLTFKTELLPST